jgi:hypothetical protein
MNSYIVFLATLDHVCKTILSLVIWESNNRLFIYFNENFKKVKMATFIGVMKPHLNKTMYFSNLNIERFTENVVNLSKFFGFEENFLAISSMTKQQNIWILLSNFGIWPFF